MKAEQFLALSGVMVPIRVDEIGETVYVKQLSASEKMTLILDWLDVNRRERDPLAAARWIVVCFRDADGKRIFQDGYERDILSLPSAVVDRYAAAVLDVNSAEPIDIEAEKKRLQTTPTDSQPTGSPGSGAELNPWT